MARPRRKAIEVEKIDKKELLKEAPKVSLK